MTLKLNITITIFISIVIIVAVGTTDFQHKIHLELDDQTHFNRESSATEKFQKEPNNYYTIQFIATPSRIMANNHVARLRNANVDAYVTSGGNCGKPCFRVRGGGIFESPQTARMIATQLQIQLSRTGLQFTPISVECDNACYEQASRF